MQIIIMSEICAEYIMCCFSPVFSSVEIDRIFKKSDICEASTKSSYIFDAVVLWRGFVTIIFVNLKVGGAEKTIC